MADHGLDEMLRTNQGQQQMATPTMSDSQRRVYTSHGSQKTSNNNMQGRSMIRDPIPQKVQSLENFQIEKVLCGSD